MCYKWRTLVAERREEFIFPFVFFLLAGQMEGWWMCPCEVWDGKERMQEHAEPVCTAPCHQKPASRTACIHQREPTWRKEGVSWQADKRGTDRSIYHMSLFVMLRFVFCFVFFFQITGHLCIHTFFFSWGFSFPLRTEYYRNSSQFNSSKKKKKNVKLDI